MTITGHAPTCEIEKHAECWPCQAHGESQPATHRCNSRGWPMCGFHANECKELGHTSEPLQMECTCPQPETHNRPQEKKSCF